MNIRTVVARLAALCGFMAGMAGAAHAAEAPSAACAQPPELHCPPTNCPGALVTQTGSTIEPKTGRPFFLDIPCDLKPGDKVVFVLSLHGGGSYGNWQRNYFPLMDFKDRYRLVIATPNAPPRVWMPSDDEYLQNIVTMVIDRIGRQNIQAFWLVGHSQGGMTSNRLVCTPFFRTKVDGWLSLSGGRLGPMAPPPADFFGPRPPGASPPGESPPGAAPATPGATPAAPLVRPSFGPRPLPDCDFNFIYETGEYELGAPLPETSVWADRFNCQPRQQQPDVVDTTPGLVYDGTRQNPSRRAWGGLPRPGSAHIWTYGGCRDNRLVADVVRLDKGHTEGLEPNITETLVRMMVWAPGGKIARGG